MSLLAVISAACGDSVTEPLPDADPLYYLKAPTNSGDGQTDTVLATLANPFRVLVRRGDTPAPGVIVLWEMPEDALRGIPGFSIATVTDAAGIASYSLTLGRTADPTYAVTAHVPGAIAPAPITVARGSPCGAGLCFTATASPGKPTSLRIVSGNNQTDATNMPLAADYVVQTADRHGNVVSGVVIDWAVTGGEGSIAPLQSTTVAPTGHASARHTLGPAEGTHAATATASALPSAPHVTFTATAILRGGVRVTTTTTGLDPDPDGYAVNLDGTTKDTTIALAVNTSTTISRLPPGDYNISLGGVIPNCTVAGANPRSVTVVGNSTSEVAFEVSCIALGALEVTVATTGVDLDNSYILSLSGGRGSQSSGEFRFSGLFPGEYTMTLGDVALNCDVIDPNPRSVTVPSGSTVAVTIDVSCAALMQLAVERYPAIYVINSNGTGFTCLTCNQADEATEPAWSPDGSKIAFTSHGEIYVMNADGTTPIRLTNEVGGNISPAWSPDGSKIAFVSFRDGNGEIYVMNADGTNPIRLTEYAETNQKPAWSPDGNKIAFARWVGSGYAIYVMTVDGSNIARLTQGDDFDPDWSPDGTKLVFWRLKECGTWFGESYCATDLYITNADGSGITQLVGSPEGYPAEFTGPAWSPDGRLIAFSAKRFYCDYYYGPCPGAELGVEAVRIDGSGLTRIGGDELPWSNPAWRRP
jgi:Tol biopolymer transport system component